MKEERLKNVLTAIRGMSEKDKEGLILDVVYVLYWHDGRLDPEKPWTSDTIAEVQHVVSNSIPEIHEETDEETADD